MRAVTGIYGDRENPYAAERVREGTNWTPAQRATRYGDICDEARQKAQNVAAPENPTDGAWRGRRNGAI